MDIIKKQFDSLAWHRSRASHLIARARTHQERTGKILAITHNAKAQIVEIFADRHGDELVHTVIYGCSELAVYHKDHRRPNGPCYEEWGPTTWEKIEHELDELAGGE